jgi:uncharacterized membrane protein
MQSKTIRSPLEWTGSQVMHAVHGVAWFGRSMGHAAATLHSPAPAVKRIQLADLAEVLEKGLSDFAAYRSDVFFLLFFYPVLNLLMARVAFDMNLLPLLFPLASGFAIIGPFTAIGLCEMSRRREQGMEVNWRNGFDVINRPAIGGIMLLGALLAGLFLLWLAAAWRIYGNTMGPALPTSMADFARDVLTTAEGHAMIVLGVGVGFLFAVVAMTISVVAFPLLVDRDAGLDTAMMTSVRAVLANPVPMLGWGAIVALGLVIGTIPAFIGLIVVMPVLGHATWHLYRKLVGN